MTRIAAALGLLAAGLGPSVAEARPAQRETDPIQWISDQGTAFYDAELSGKPILLFVAATD